MSEDWESLYQRLLAAIEANGRSAHAIGREGGLGQNYIEQFQKKPPAHLKKMQLQSLFKLCRALGLSPIYVFTGVRLTPEGESVLRLYEQMTEAEKEAFRVLFRAEQ